MIRIKIMATLIVSLGLSFILGSPGRVTASVDLVVKRIFFDDNNVLNVTFANEGDTAVPEGKGNLIIIIDGRLLGEYAFSMLSDQSFRAPGGSQTIRTNFRMGGSNRRIAIRIDTLNEVAESNEFQNTLSRTMTPPPKNEPDFIVSDLSLDPRNRLRIKVRNIGTAASRADLSVRVRVIVNERVAADLTPALPALAADGGSTMILPSPDIVVAAGSKVRVLLNVNSLYDELDNTNNIREEILPDGPSLARYSSLLALRKIRNNIIWQESSGLKNYAAWTAAQRDALNNSILALENGESATLEVPPALLAGNSISSGDAWRIYLAHIAQSLWVEVHWAVFWRLADFTDSQLSYLLDSRKLFRYDSGSDVYRFDNAVMGNITAWDPRSCYMFLYRLGMIKLAQIDTIYALTDWMRGHLMHVIGDMDYSAQYGYAGPPAADKILYPLENKRHISAGCICTTGLYGAVLRSVNIPVEHAQIDLVEATHNRPAFPSVDRSLVHGDDVHCSYLIPSGAVIPSARLFYTYAQMESRFIHPPVDCIGTRCNREYEQIGYNYVKDQLQLAYDLMGDGLLDDYAVYGAAHLNDSLRGPRVGDEGRVREFVKPYFTDAERTAMVRAVEDRIREIGGGNLETGKTIVMTRRYRFYQNK